MQEVSDKIIVLLVIVAVIVSVVGTFVVTTTAFNAVKQGQNSPVQQVSQPDNSGGVVSLVVVDDVNEGDSGGG